MQTVLCALVCLAAYASPETSSGHVAPARRATRLGLRLQQHGHEGSDSQVKGIGDVLAKIRGASVDLTHSLTGAAPVQDKRGANVFSPTPKALEKHRKDLRGNNSAGVLERKPMTRHKRAGVSSCSLLAFVPVGSFELGGQLLKGNLEHLHLTLSGYCNVTVFLNHYDGKKGHWITQTNMWEKGWYHRHVKYSTSVPGYKFQVMQKLLHQVDMASFNWVWALDEDFNILNTDVKRALHLAKESKALIALPAFTQVGDSDEERKLNWPMQTPNPDCLYRYADVVEVIFPMFRTEALELLLWDCEHCIGETTVWGLNRMWCSYSARRLGRDRNTACAIIDATPMVHQNFKTLGHKYDRSDNSSEANYEVRAREESAALQKLYPQDFVEGDSFVHESGMCVKPDDRIIESV